MIVVITGLDSSKTVICFSSLLLIGVVNGDA